MADDSLVAARRMRKPRNGPLRKFAEEAAASTEMDVCIIWPFTKGYSHMRDWRVPVPEGKTRRPNIGVHRLVWELANGQPMPGELQARHLCGNGAGGCVNPNHIVPGTSTENNRDTVLHGHKRNNPWNTKLTDEQVRAIRVAPGFQREVAARFGIDQATVSRIRRGKLFVHVD